MKNESECSKVGALHRSPVGVMAADVWQVQERWRARYIYDPSPWFRWHDRYYLAVVLHGLVMKKEAAPVTTSVLRQSVLRMGYTPAQFPPSAAKAFIEKYQAKTVLDPFSGWGDRLVGFLASSAITYIGADTNKGLHFGYKHCWEHYAPEKQVVIQCADSRDVTTWEHAQEVDLILTSPPYAYHEQYLYGKTPKCDIAKWADEFLLPIMKATTNKLRSGGYVVLHMNNVTVRNKPLMLVSEVLRIMQGLVEYQGCFGLVGQTRKVTHGEPLMVWRKP
jgi:hypothetical protein